MRLFAGFVLICLSLAASATPLSIGVSIAPQKQFVEKIGGDRVKVTVMVPPGAAAETYSPTPRQLSEIARAKIYFKVGFGFEAAFLDKLAANCPDLEIVDCRHNLKLRRMENHSHEGVPCSGHDSPYDPHIWTAPRQVMIQAETICRTLCRLDPAGRESYEKNLAAFQKELDEVDRYITAKLAPYKGSSFYIYHPGFGYFGDDYGIKQVALELGGKKPSPKQLSWFLKQAKQENIKMIFIQRQFSTSSAEALAREIGAKVIVVDNLEEDFLTTVRQTADKIEAALKPAAVQAPKEHHP